MSMRQIEVDGVAFKWKAGKRFLRIQGNGRSVDITLDKFLSRERVPGKERVAREALARRIADFHDDDKRTFSIQPKDIERYIRKYEWHKKAS